MKNNHSYRHFKIVGILFSLMINAGLVKSQDTLKTDKTLYYRLTIGAGIGSGPFRGDNFGIGIMGDLELQRKNNLYAIGIHHTEEFEVIGFGSAPTIANNSLEIMYGRVFTYNESLLTMLSIGLGMFQGIRHGDISSYDYYEKKKIYSPAIPLSGKIILKSKHRLIEGGIGLELFLNINSKNTFGGANLIFHFGKFKR